ncbi:hypothetical protein [Burkholderia ambifaria]|uniref:hypothetical protein n=1 Tax=Burkholderia ambifaria TaxID=152480 RepID=UPI000F81065B|nr:hypothetical protein [Burkholderia ambifaria]
MNEIRNPDGSSDNKDKCRTCGAASAAEAWDKCNASGDAHCYGLLLFPVDVRISRVKCAAVGAEAIDDPAHNPSQISE